MTTYLLVRGAMAVGLAIGLAACGGGSEIAAVTPAAAASSLDDSTLQSFLAYQRTLAPVEVIDPMTLQKQLAPIDDTGEPSPIN